LKNLLDEAILDHQEMEERLKAKEKYHKIDEIPFDFVRRRMSVVVEDEAGLNTLICKARWKKCWACAPGWKSKARSSRCCPNTTQTPAVGG